MSKQGAYLSDLRAADKKAQDIINEAYEKRRVQKQQAEAQANKELETIKKQLQADILGTSENKEGHDSLRQKLKEETDKKLAELKKKAGEKMNDSLGLILHFVTKVNPKATKENVQAFQQKAIQSVS
eukprot:jgi/Bigna1/91599/estExt_fgenesh1_pg.C_1080031